MISIIVLTSLTPIFILIIGMLLIFSLNERFARKSFTGLIIILSLLMNSILLIYFIYTDTIVRDYALNLEKGTFLLTEIILAMGLMITVFSKEEVEILSKENYHDGLVLLILLGLIGTIITSNLVIIYSCFFLSALFIGVIFFFGDYPKQYKLLKWYFISVGVSIILLSISLLTIFIKFQTLIITEIKLQGIDDPSNIFLSVFLFFGMGIPCGLFPFSLYHLKTYFQDSSYSGLYLFSIFSFTTILLTSKLLNLFTLNLLFNGLLILIISAIGLIISLIYILTELFTSIDGDTFSIKKLFGFTLISDFNIYLLLLSFTSFLNSIGITINTYINTLLFYFLIIISIKSLIFYTFLPILSETLDDNLKLLGGLWNKYRAFGILLFISGIILSVPFALFSFNSFLSVYLVNEVIGNSFYAISASIIFILYLLYFIVLLIFVSISFIQIYFSNEPRYIERDMDKEVLIRINRMVPLIPILIIIGMVNIFFIFFNNLYFMIFKSFLLILE